MASDTNDRAALNRRVAEMCGWEITPYWYCNTCLTGIEARNVTYDERCSECKNHVEWVKATDFTSNLNAIVEACAVLGFFSISINWSQIDSKWRANLTVADVRAEEYADSPALALTRAVVASGG